MKKLMSLMLLALVCLTSCTSSNPATQTPKASEKATAQGLKDIYAEYFTVGAAVTPWNVKGEEADLILREFNSLTAENAMKMGPIHPKEDVYNWRGADSIAAFARRHNFKMRGHALCWHNQAPDWFFKDTNGNDVTKEVLLQRLKDHITAVVTRYKGIVYAWDVVNEAISDNPNEFFRNSAFYRICGEEYIQRAFEYAHAADPNAQLFYNDYNEIIPVKREKIIRLVKSLREKAVPIHAVGLQGHWGVNEPSREQLEKTLADFSTLGMDMQITELDISIYEKEHSSRDKRPSDIDTIFTHAKEQQQMEKYKMCFELFRKYGDKISSVTFWNLTDRSSWLDNFPVRGRKDYPLLFDTRLQPKKAYYEVTRF